MAGSMTSSKKLKDLFLGEYVFITIRNFIASQLMEDEESGQTVQTQGVSYVTGYILDIDNEYYYLGNTPDGVDTIVQRSEAIKIEISSEAIIIPHKEEDRDLQ